jgi:hypothetical protein
MTVLVTPNMGDLLIMTLLNTDFTYKGFTYNGK